MKILFPLMLLSPALLVSCLTEANWTFSKPSHRDLVGTYRVSKVSSFVPNRARLKGVELRLRQDGTYVFNDSPHSTAVPLLPSLTGTWCLKPAYGRDLGSREQWTVELHSNRSATAWCLGDRPPYRLQFL